jgi:pre-mRNA-processing factor 40
MLGNPGSNPLELFWDLVDDLDQKLDAKIAIVDTAFRKASEHRGEKADQDGAAVEGIEVKPDSTVEEFMAAVEAVADAEVKKLTSADISEVFHTVRKSIRAHPQMCS